MFEKTLTDVVKGIRASKRDTALYISQCIAEIKQEMERMQTLVKKQNIQFDGSWYLSNYKKAKAQHLGFSRLLANWLQS